MAVYQSTTDTSKFFDIDTSDNPSNEEIKKRLTVKQKEYDLQTHRDGMKEANGVWEKVKKAATVVKDNVAEMPEAIAEGIFNASAQATRVLDENFAGGLIEKASKGFNKHVFDLGDYHVDENNVATYSRQYNEDGTRKWGDTPIFNTDTVGGNLTSGISQFGVGFVMANTVGKFSLPATTSKYISRAYNLAAGVIAPQIVFDPYAPRISNFVNDYLEKQHPDVKIPFMEWVEADPDDPEALARFKMFMEDLGLEATIGATFIGIGNMYRKMKRGEKIDKSDIDEFSKLTDEFFGGDNNLHVSIKNLDKEIKAVNADKEFITSRVNLKSLLDKKTISRAEYDARLKDLKSKRIDEIPAPYVNKKEMPTDHESILREMDRVYATLFHDNPTVQEMLTRMANQGIKDVKGTAKNFALLGRIHEKSVRDLVMFKSEYENVEEIIIQRIKDIDARTDIDATSKLIQKNGVAISLSKAKQKEEEVISNYLMSMQAYMGEKSDIGRALNMTKIWGVFEDGTDPLIAKRTFNEMVKSLRGKDRNTFTVNFLNKIKDGGVWTLRALDEMFIASILSSGKTHVINGASNLAIGVVQPIERLAAAGIRATVLLDPKGAKKQSIAAIAELYGKGASLRQSVFMGAKAYQQGKTFLDVNTTFEQGSKTVIGKDIPFTKESLKELGKWITLKGDKVTMMDLLGTGFRAISTRALTAEDEMFKQIAFRGHIYGNTFADSLTKNMDSGMGWKEAAAKANLDAEEHVARGIDYQMMKGKMAESGQSYITNDKKIVSLADNALQSSREQTFTQDLKEGGKNFQQTVATIPLLRQVAPFVRTPLNLISHSIQRSPLAPFVSGRWWDNINAGGEKRALALTHFSMGMGILTYMTDIFGTMDGISPEITGQGSNNWQERKNDAQLAGEISGSYVSPDGQQTQITRIDPFSTIFEGIAAIKELHRQGYAEEADSVFTAYSMAITNMLLNDTYATSVRQLMNAMNDPTGNGMERFIYKRMGQVTPWSGLQQGANRQTDPFQRELRNWYDGILMSTIGMSKYVAPSYNALGEAVERVPYASLGMLETEIETPVRGGTGTVKVSSKKVEEFFSPILAGKKKNDLIAKEVLANNLSSSSLPRYILDGAIDLNSPSLNTTSDGTDMYPHNPEGGYLTQRELPLDLQNKSPYKRTALDRWNELLSRYSAFPDPNGGTEIDPQTGQEKPKMVTLRGLLEYVISTDAYQDKATDEIRIYTTVGKRKSMKYRGSRKDVLDTVISEAKEIAKMMLIKENPMLKAEYEKVTMMQALVKSHEGQEEVTHLNSVLEGAN